MSFKAQSLFLLGGFLVGYVAKMNPTVAGYSFYLAVAIFLIGVGITIRAHRLTPSKKARWLNYAVACLGLVVGLLVFPS